MKKVILLMFLFCVSSLVFAQGIWSNKIDPFTGDTVIQTFYEDLKGCDFEVKIKRINNNYFLETKQECKNCSGFEDLNVNVGDKLMMILTNKTNLTLTVTGQNEKMDQTMVSFNWGYGFTTKSRNSKETKCSFLLSDNDKKLLLENGVIKVRVYRGESFHDDDVKERSRYIISDILKVVMDVSTTIQQN